MILTGDCVEVMATLDAESIDAIVTDPPYGLEFMGKSWDRLDGVGQTSHAGPTEPSGDRNQYGRVAYNGSANRKCRTCQKWAYSGTPCRCEVPDFPSIVNAQSAIMQGWHERWAAEAFRVAKPGAYLLAFGGTRTYHRLASAIEDAGWEIRDTLVWGYASGFPKSLDVSKAIDKAAGAARRETGLTYQGATNISAPGGTYITEAPTSGRTIVRQTAPATEAAVRWVGWGTALKPAWEPIVMARKPLVGTVAANVQAHGTGALNIDGTRIPMGEDDREKFERGAVAWREMSERRGDGSTKATDIYGTYGIASNPVHEQGRWPANVLLTDAVFDDETIEVVGGRSGDPAKAERRGRRGGLQGWMGQEGFGTPDAEGHWPSDDGGGYSRFFLIPKAGRGEREPEWAPPVRYDHSGPRGHSLNGDGTPRPPALARANTHPTVKPVRLMRHLVRLVTPPGGTVLDPFLGSGTTALAARDEGHPWVGIEREAEYVAIAEARLAEAPPAPDLVQLALFPQAAAPVRVRDGLSTLLWEEAG